MLNGLDLFSGIGGNTLGLDGYVRTVAYCEQDRHAQSVLLSRMLDGSIRPAPIWDDITPLSGDTLPPVDIIVGGFPCQDISVAGKGAGLEGERSGLFFEVVRLAKEIKPTFLFLENVPAIRTRGLDRVIQELTTLGYDLRWTMLSAAEVGALHKRDRWFLLAYANRELIGNKRKEVQPENQEVGSQSGAVARDHGSEEPMADSDSGRKLQSGRSLEQVGRRVGYGGWWKSEPDVGRVAHGVPLRVDRLKRLGNAVVPAQARTAFEILMGIKDRSTG